MRHRHRVVDMIECQIFEQPSVPCYRTVRSSSDVDILLSIFRVITCTLKRTFLRNAYFMLSANKIDTITSWCFAIFIRRATIKKSYLLF